MYLNPECTWLVLAVLALAVLARKLILLSSSTPVSLRKLNWLQESPCELEVGSWSRPKVKPKILSLNFVIFYRCLKILFIITIFFQNFRLYIPSKWNISFKKAVSIQKQGIWFTDTQGFWKVQIQDKFTFWMVKVCSDS